MTHPDYMLDDRTHRYWWTWVAAWPLSNSDPFYKMLWNVFSDHTTNCRKADGRWTGCYTEGNELHQTLGVFHNFSALPTTDWLESLLRDCNVDFCPPITSVRWQYELRGRDTRALEKTLHADIAMRIADSRGLDDEIALVFEAKRAKGRLKRKDHQDADCYTYLDHLKSFRRKYARRILDRNDLSNIRQGDLTWQVLSDLQLNAFDRLIMPESDKRRLNLALLRYLNWFDSVNDGADLASSLEAPPSDLPPRLSALVLGLETVTRARKRLPLPFSPTFPWLAEEQSIEDYRQKKYRTDGDWYEPVW